MRPSKTAPCGTSIARSIYFLARRTLVSLLSPRITSTSDEPYDITSLQNLFIMKHSLKRGFALKMCHDHIYLSREPSTLPPQLLRSICLLGVQVLC